MLGKRTSALEELQTMLAQGFDLIDVDSTDDHMLVVLQQGTTRRTVALDRDECERLVVDRLLDRRPMLS